MLTRFTVSQALEELLDQDGRTTTAGEILQLSVCEPALGSGAFAIEAVRQLAAEYLKRRQDEVGTRIDPDDYAYELQKVKAHVALHQVHGVDLNATAVELAEVSLWLDTMVKGLSAPWFGLRLRRGNSLIGARRATYTQSQLKDRSWLTATPTDVPLTELAENINNGVPFSATSSRVHHFLLPAQGWGSATEVPKDVASLALEAVAALKTWRKSVRTKPTTKQIQQLTALGERVEKLWQFALRRLRIAEAESSRIIELWGRETPAHTPVVTREQIEASLADENGAYRRLRLVMDLWCALWFWPLTEANVKPPSLDEWIRACEAILGVSPQAKNRWMDTFSGDSSSWEGLNAEEEDDVNWSGAQSIEALRTKYAWIVVGERVSRQNGFFHWELDFVSVLARGGFDLQVGNPPWVTLSGDFDAELSEVDPWWVLRDHTTPLTDSEMLPQTLSVAGAYARVIDRMADVPAQAAFVGGGGMYPELAGLPPDLYRAFIIRCWSQQSQSGAVALIHYDTHFSGSRAGPFRRLLYRRLRAHWHFVNELKLFEMGDQKHYSVNVYGGPREEVHFSNACFLYHPDTVTRSLEHDGSGEEPGYKTPQGDWDLRPHRSRIQSISDKVLEVWSDVIQGPGGMASTTPMLYAVSVGIQEVTSALATARAEDAFDLEFSSGWDESAHEKSGHIERHWGPSADNAAVLLGPNIYAGAPYFKRPNATMKNKADWTIIDLEELAPDQPYVVSFRRRSNGGGVSRAPVGRFGEIQAFRMAWRRRAANTGERTLIPSLIPPGVTHVDGIASCRAAGGVGDLVSLTGFSASLLADFTVRVVPKADIRADVINRLPVSALESPLRTMVDLRVLQLTCLTRSFAALWEECWDPAFAHDEPVVARRGTYFAEPTWDPVSGIRLAADRRGVQ
ncbi:MAG: DNA methyltransferase, partial [Aquihabitans sp.]